MPKQKPQALDLYAKVEDLLGVKEASPILYAHYLLHLSTLSFNTLLDVGCGSGDFLRQMHRSLAIPKVKGIDLSPIMVSRTIQEGYDAQCIDLCQVEGSFDVITAVFDMINYLDKKTLKTFLACVESHLNEGGVFLCDINTLYGFEAVAVGSFIVDDTNRFLTVDSEFDNNIYQSEFTLFEKEGTRYIKSQENISQYYHTIEDIKALTTLTLITQDEVNLYELESSDKHFLVFKK